MNFLEEFSSNEEDYDENDENYNIEDNNIQCKDEKFILEKDSESIFTLSKKTEIQNNKKIQFIKQMFNYLLKNFTFTESLIIHSIYNHNVKCFLIRSKIFKEYILILNILNHLYIKFTKTISYNIFNNIPISDNSKKFIKINNEIKENFDFTEFKQKYSYEEDTNTKIIPKLIKYYVNGFLFYLKNLLILPHNYTKIMELYNMSKENIDEVTNILLEDPNCSFCNDPNLKILSDWISNIIKKLFLYNIYAVKNNYSNSINIKKIFDTQVHILINIFLYLIIICNTPYILYKEKMEKKKIEIFLTYNFRDQEIIMNFIKNKQLIKVLKYVYETKFNKNMFSSKKFVRFFYKHLL